MNDTRLEELREKYKNRNLLEELAWGTYANHSGYTSKQNGEFINWLCNVAYRTIKATELIKGEWIPIKTRPLTEEEKEQNIGINISSEFAYDCELPEDGQKVHITTKHGEVDTTTFCDDGMAAWFEFYADEGEVVAWMPLPQRYEAESEVEEGNYEGKNNY